MIIASAWSSRWAAGTAALLLAGGSALPGADLRQDETAPGSAVEILIPVPVPTDQPSLGPHAEPAPDEDEPTDSEPVEQPGEEPAEPTDSEPVEQPDEDEPTDSDPVEQPGEEPAEDEPTDGDLGEKPEDTEPVPAGPVLVVVPEPVRSVVDGAPGYTLPLGDGGFTWIVNGVRVDELGAAARLVESPDGSWYELSAVALGTDVERLVLAVVAAPGHAFLGADGSTGEVRYVVDPRLPAELVAPTALDGEGREDAVVVPEAATQVVLDAAGEVLDAGTHPVTAEYVDGVATVALTVMAADGHRLEVGGTPVETVPGAGGTSEVVLVLTDVPPAVAEPVPSPAETPTPPATEAPADTPTRDSGAEPDQLGLAAPLVTVSAAVPEPAVTAAVTAEPAEADALEELPESGPEGLGLMVMLGGLLLGGSWLVLGMRGD